MSNTEAKNPQQWTRGRVMALALLVLLAIAAGYRAWIDIVTIGLEDPEQSQVLLAIPAFLALLYFRKSRLEDVPIKSSVFGLLLAGAGWAISWLGYLNAVQTLWHAGALLMVVGAVWSVIGNRAMLLALPAAIALAALVPVPNLLRQDIALPLQRMTASGAEFVLIATGFDVKRIGLTLFYQDKPITIEEACNGMRMVFALLLVCYTFVMSLKLTPFARLMLLGFSPLLAVLCNIIRVVPTVVIYGQFGDGMGDVFHDVSGWAMVIVSALMLMGLIRVLNWAEVPIYADREVPVREPLPRHQTRKLPVFLEPVVLASLMIIAAVHSVSMPSAADAKPYHQAVAQTAQSTPLRIEGFKAEPIEIPEGSLKLLRPNTARAVKYTDKSTETVGQFLLIQSKDARDLSGHYPPRCYPNVYGYTEIDRKTREWVVGGRTYSGVEYTFAETTLRGAQRWVVLHFFALPGGEITGDLTRMREAAADYLRRHKGAAQVQMMFSASESSGRQRDLIFERVLDAHAPLLQAIITEPTK